MIRLLIKLTIVEQKLETVYIANGVDLTSVIYFALKLDSDRLIYIIYNAMGEGIGLIPSWETYI